MNKNKNQIDDRQTVFLGFDYQLETEGWIKELNNKKEIK
jgi:hypothetical protein